MQPVAVDGEEEEEEDDVAIKRSVRNLNAEECQMVTKIHSPTELYKFDMNHVLDSEDEVNIVKRKPRTRHDLAIVRPWQNQVMATFLDILFRESPHGYLFRQTV